ncbi:MAG: ABC transporter ATP-binding protein [Pseudomonadota bacterium]
MAIRFEGVEKSYVVYDRPQDRLWEWLTRRPRHRRHVALSAIDFEVRPGETFGLVGENGAGKSTLLKIAAGTIRPTRGVVHRSGRVAALLELGAGFHPEENGYDNIRFMAALYGLDGQAMAAFVDRTIDFAELPAEALSRPVKTYSSGMFMRLAFSAATAIDPELLIVDEALSVGDMHFQKKSLDRILRLRDQGATILFCSHNLYQVRSLCQRAAWIHQGRTRALGATEEVVTAYEAHERQRYAHLKDGGSFNTNGEQPVPQEQPPVPSGAPLVKILGLSTETEDGIDPAFVRTFERLALVIELEAYTDDPFHVLFAIVRPDKENVFGTSTHFRPGGRPLRGRGRHTVRVVFPRLPLLSGKYLWSVYALDDTGLQAVDMAELIQPFTVLSHDGREFGVAWFDHAWIEPSHD